MTENTWERYLTDYNEGLGLVYERFVLNDFLDDLRRRYAIRSVLEAPLYGMAGVSGINDVVFARRGVDVTMVDDTPVPEAACSASDEDLVAARQFSLHRADQWGGAVFRRQQLRLHVGVGRAVVHQRPGRAVLRELVRTSRDLVFVAMPNNIQVGYWMRKLVIDREFLRSTTKGGPTSPYPPHFGAGRRGDHRPGCAGRAAVARHGHAR
ncbi:MAG: hypothetical protein R2854_22935 [Caldilineaceae bacterium]